MAILGKNIGNNLSGSANKQDAIVPNAERSLQQKKASKPVPAASAPKGAVAAGMLPSFGDGHSHRQVYMRARRARQGVMDQRSEVGAAGGPSLTFDPRPMIWYWQSAKRPGSLVDR
jgi:hypothetical protein